MEGFFGPQGLLFVAGLFCGFGAYLLVCFIRGSFLGDDSDGEDRDYLIQHLEVLAMQIDDKVKRKAAFKLIEETDDEETLLKIEADLKAVLCNQGVPMLTIANKQALKEMSS